MNIGRLSAGLAGVRRVNATREYRRMWLVEEERALDWLERTNGAAWR
ncbi:hypothetical protein HRbin26_00916 [bacterium HR26]|nr:hypothetical protein HRbin26_00916 [bacterium HR26]